MINHITKEMYYDDPQTNKKGQKIKQANIVVSSLCLEWSCLIIQPKNQFIDICKQSSLLSSLFLIWLAGACLCDP